MLAADLDANGMILDLASGNFIELNAVAYRLWGMIETPVALSDLCARLADEYAVDPETCRREVGRWVEDMVARQLVRVD